MERAIGNCGKRVLWDGFQRISLQAENGQFDQSRFLILVHQITGADLGEVEFIVIQKQICQIRLIRKKES